jgi:DNA repair protein RadC
MRRPIYLNPEIYEGPDVSDYEGMKVQFIPGEFRFPQVHAALDFVKFAEDLGLFADVRERVYAVYLNQKNRILGYRLVGSGSAHSSIADPVVIFGPAMILHAAGFAVLHNHPSRELDPSPEDKALAKRLIAGAELLSIHLLDFVVVGGNQYFSFHDEMPDLWQR